MMRIALLVLLVEALPAFAAPRVAVHPLLGGAGLVAAGVATAVAVALQPSRQIVAAARDEDGNIDRLRIPRAKALDNDIAIATALYVGAGVALAASIAIILLSSDRAPPVVIASVPGGIVVGFGGTFQE